MSLKDDWREVVLDLHEQGLPRYEITELVPISSAYVSQIVAEAGRSFAETDLGARATQGRIAKRARGRVAKATRLIPLAEQAFDAGDVDGFLVLCRRIDKLLGFGPVESIRGTEKDPQWIAKMTGLPDE